MMTEDPDAEPAGAKEPVSVASVQRISAGDDTGPLWGGLRDLWLTNRVLSGQDASRSAAYSWEANDYVPVFQVNGDGEPRMLFARES